MLDKEIQSDAKICPHSWSATVRANVIAMERLKNETSFILFAHLGFFLGHSFQSSLFIKYCSMFHFKAVVIFFS